MSLEHKPSNPPPAVIGDRLNPETDTEQKLPQSGKPNLSLEYKPVRPSHASHFMLTQIIKPGKPLPDGSNGSGTSGSSLLIGTASTNQPPSENPTAALGLFQLYFTKY